jgi:hypothetical protein
MFRLVTKKLTLITSLTVIALLVLTACGGAQTAAPTQAPTQAPTEAVAIPTPTEAAMAPATTGRYACFGQSYPRCSHVDRYRSWRKNSVVIT